MQSFTGPAVREPRPDWWRVSLWSDVQIPVIGIGGGKAPKDLEELVFQMATEAATLLGKPSAVKRSAVVATDPNPIQYGHLTREVADVIRLFARTEGILVDPAYTGPALVGLLELIRQGKFKPDSNVVFIHTGGVAALFGYVDFFAEATSSKSRPRIRPAWTPSPGTHEAGRLVRGVATDCGSRRGLDQTATCIRRPAFTIGCLAYAPSSMQPGP